ncbi:MAG: NADH-quinone oxidoreductase subunit NuoE [Candidatus Eisenbacteria bacterium]|nr:NADH-quinone oxidoreductase subunit NuoE [Candidatus Eisenbacteria bacterium]
MLSEKLINEVKVLIARYPEKRSALIPALHAVHAEQGHVSDDSVKEVAAVFELTPAQVYEVLSFYSMFERKPAGRHIITVCRNLSCSLLGAESIIEFLESLLGVKVGETTPDLKFSLRTAECLGSCDTAPVMQIDDEYYESLTPEKVKKIIEELK